MLRARGGRLAAPGRPFGDRRRDRHRLRSVPAHARARDRLRVQPDFQHPGAHRLGPAPQVGAGPRRLRLRLRQLPQPPRADLEQRTLAGEPARLHGCPQAGRPGPRGGGRRRRTRLPGVGRPERRRGRAHWRVQRIGDRSHELQADGGGVGRRGRLPRHGRPGEPCHPPRHRPIHDLLRTHGGSCTGLQAAAGRRGGPGQRPRDPGLERPGRQRQCALFGPGRPARAGGGHRGLPRPDGTRHSQR